MNFLSVNLELEQFLEIYEYDPDEGLELRPEVAEELERSVADYKSGKVKGRSLEEVAKDLGVDLTMYTLVIKPRAESDLQRLSAPIYIRILNKLERLRETCDSQPHKRLKGKHSDKFSLTVARHISNPLYF